MKMFFQFFLLHSFLTVALSQTQLCEVLTPLQICSVCFLWHRSNKKSCVCFTSLCLFTNKLAWTGRCLVSVRAAAWANETSWTRGRVRTKRKINKKRDVCHVSERRVALSERRIKAAQTEEIKVCYASLSRDTLPIKTGLINNHSQGFFLFPFLMPKFGSVTPQSKLSKREMPRGIIKLHGAEPRTGGSTSAWERSTMLCCYCYKMWPNCYISSNTWTQQEVLPRMQ